jgi:hypothetical protein
MNRPIHFEIAVEDMERTANFYRTVFGWKIEPWGPPEYGYFHIETGTEGPGIDGGMWKRKGALPPKEAGHNAFNLTIAVVDIDAAIQKVKDAGGIITMQKDRVPGVGWLAMCMDTEGNYFGINQAE